VGHQTEGDQEEEGPNPCTKAKGLIPFSTKRVKAGAKEQKSCDFIGIQKAVVEVTQ
jgi:hypothetical protein